MLPRLLLIIEVGAWHNLLLKTVEFQMLCQRSVI